MKLDFRNVWHRWSFPPWNIFSNLLTGYHSLLVTFPTHWLFHLSALLDHPFLVLLYSLKFSRAQVSIPLFSTLPLLLSYLIQLLSLKLNYWWPSNGLLIKTKQTKKHNHTKTPILHWFLHSFILFSNQHFHLNVHQASPT